ncbi:MAG: gamma carbonic anhydrase family protein [Desulfarculaceae bacterium]|jgi:carbonic anhydrase/acetyltransferase-like protein (isoleucine patch superfamily)
MVGKVNGKTPRIDPSAFVAPGAVVLGDVELGPEASVWYGAVLRADINWIRVGARTSLQDGTIIHVSHKGQGTEVGKEVVVGHRVVLHSCTIGDNSLIGMGAVVLDQAKVGEWAVVAAGSVVAPGSEIPPYTMAMGVPAKPRRELSPQEAEAHRAPMLRYLRVMKCHQDPEMIVDFSQEP